MFIVFITYERDAFGKKLISGVYWTSYIASSSQHSLLQPLLQSACVKTFRISSDEHAVIKLMWQGLWQEMSTFFTTCIHPSIPVRTKREWYHSGGVARHLQHESSVISGKKKQNKQLKTP